MRATKSRLYCEQHITVSCVVRAGTQTLSGCRADAVLREFGDAENYLRVVEGDMREVARMLQQLSRAAADRQRPTTGPLQPTL